MPEAPATSISLFIDIKINTEHEQQEQGTASNCAPYY